MKRQVSIEIDRKLKLDSKVYDHDKLHVICMLVVCDVW